MQEYALETKQIFKIYASVDLIKNQQVKFKLINKGVT